MQGHRTPNSSCGSSWVQNVDSRQPAPIPPALPRAGPGRCAQAARASRDSLR
ncbi:conserved hypothetical protein [Burkholderia pseudomallei 576]|nr:conserved hypothetical protein [Burkholderia pseudomallei 576]